MRNVILLAIIIFCIACTNVRKRTYSKHYRHHCSIESQSYIDILKNNNVDTLICFNGDIFIYPGSASFIFHCKNGVEYLKYFYIKKSPGKVIESKVYKLPLDSVFPFYLQNKMEILNSKKYEDYIDHPPINTLTINISKDSFSYYMTLKEYLNDSNNIRSKYFKLITNQIKNSKLKDKFEYRTDW